MAPRIGGTGSDVDAVATVETGAKETVSVAVTGFALDCGPSPRNVGNCALS
ncbi:MAG: hypothetical protein M3Y07_18495 [Acidobacteriota bacterium]|nr:hypothetical protein [Acidobacteriota bacterium]